MGQPTRGGDIGAKVEVQRIISDLAASGLGIILISSELPEVLAMSDRIMVLHEGRIAAPPGGDARIEGEYDVTGQVVMAGAIDLHTHIGGGKVNTGDGGFGLPPVELM